MKTPEEIVDEVNRINNLLDVLYNKPNNEDSDDLRTLLNTRRDALSWVLCGG